jgi:hypothetical protein
MEFSVDKGRIGRFLMLPCTIYEFRPVMQGAQANPAQPMVPWYLNRATKFRGPANRDRFEISE